MSLNYKKIYQALIDRAMDRELQVYTETHHIIPRCMGGTNEANNLVVLTPEEHYIAHQLLVKMYPLHRGLAKAAVMMCRGRPSNKLYGWLRRRLSRAQSNAMTGSGNYMYGQRWVSNSTTTKKVPADQAAAMTSSKEWIAGKHAVVAPCGCLVAKRCIPCENKKQLSYGIRTDQFKINIRELFQEFVESGLSITAFAKVKGTSQPRLSGIWKKHIPEYSKNAVPGKCFKLVQ